MNRFWGWPALPAMAAGHVAGLLFLPIMPLLMGAVASGFNAGPVVLGTIASLQLGATAIGAFLFSTLGSRYDCRILVLFAILVETLVNSACVLTESISTLAVLRTLAGLAEGMLLAGASATAAMSRKTERVFVVYNVALALFAVAGLLLGTRLIQLYGYAGGFVLFAALDLVALGLIVRGFPSCNLQPAHSTEGNARPAPRSLNSSALLAMVLFGAALAGAQTFIERLGIGHGGSLSTIGAALAAGWCLAVVSPFLVVPLLRSNGAFNALLVAYAFVLMIALALSLTTSLPVYLIAAALFTPTVMFIEPLQFGILGALDRTGRLAALGPAALSIGSGAGPIIAGALAGVLGLQSIGFFAGILILLSGIVLLPLAVKVYRAETAH